MTLVCGTIDYESRSSGAVTHQLEPGAASRFRRLDATPGPNSMECFTNSCETSGSKSSTAKMLCITLRMQPQDGNEETSRRSSCRMILAGLALGAGRRGMRRASPGAPRCGAPTRQLQQTTWLDPSEAAIPSGRESIAIISFTPRRASGHWDAETDGTGYKERGTKADWRKSDVQSAALIYFESIY